MTSLTSSDLHVQLDLQPLPFETKDLSISNDKTALPCPIPLNLHTHMLHHSCLYVKL